MAVVYTASHEVVDNLFGYLSHIPFFCIEIQSTVSVYLMLWPASRWESTKCSVHTQSHSDNKMTSRWANVIFFFPPRRSCHIRKNEKGFFFQESGAYVNKTQQKICKARQQRRNILGETILKGTTAAVMFYFYFVTILLLILLLLFFFRF